MNNLRNRIQLIGNLGSDPEISNFDSGKKKATFTIATNDYYKTHEGEKIQDTQWHQVIAWNKQADLIESYVKKGQEIALDGKLINRNYKDKEGVTRYVTEIILNEVLLLNSK